ncbi:hypothetical protein RYX36_025246 [Vicia faba]
MGLDRYGSAPFAGRLRPLGSATSGLAAADATATPARRRLSILSLRNNELVEKFLCVLKKGVTKDEANPIIEKLKELGATIVLK